MDEQRAWIRSRRKKRLRIVAVILCMCLLATTRADILATLSTFASEWKDSTVYVSGFGELPEAVREQTVPLGTGVEELSLPDTLEAFAEAPEEEDKPVDADKPGDGSGETGNHDDGEGGTENPGDGSGETGNPDDGTGESGNPGEGSDNGNGDAGNADEGNGGTGEAGDGTGESGNPGEGSDGGSGDAGNLGEETAGESGDAGNTDEGNSNAGESDGDSSGSEPESSSDSAPADDEGDVEAADEMAKGIDGALIVQRGVFVMPVYLSETLAIAEPQTMERKKESVMIKGVTWQSEPAYDGDTEGTYLFTAVLPEGYALTEGVSLPQITVTVQGMDPVVQELLARIAALPEAEEYLADEPDVEAEDEYEAWMDGLSTYTAEALELWEMYETFTEEQRALVPTEALVRLAAWVELAGQLAEGMSVTAEVEAETIPITVNLWRNGARWGGQEIRLKCDGKYYPTTETDTGVYTGTAERGGTCYACLNGNESSIGSLGVSTNGADGTLTFRYVTVTYKNDGATGTVPEEESYYCGRVNRNTPMQYNVNPDLPLTKPGYVQTGWSETSGGSGEKVTEIIVNQGTGDETGIRTTPIVLYPVFEPATVTIDAANCTNNGAAVVGSGDYTVTFTPEDGYHVPKTVTVQIGSTTLGSGEYTYTNGKLTIPRSKIMGNVTITTNASSEHSLTYAADNAQGTITESCGNGCTHSVTVEFETFLTEPYTYTGNAIEPFRVKYTPAASAWLGTVKPVIRYTNNTDAGTVTATLSVGSTSVSKKFTITAKPLTDAVVTLDSTLWQYTGQEIKPGVTVKDGSKTLTGEDYTVSYENNTAVSTDTDKAQVIIKGKGNYSGERRAEFTIQDNNPPEVSESDLDIDYSGGTVKLPDDIKDEVEIYDSDGNKITPNPDGSLPVEPGTIIKIKYPGSDKETVITIPGRLVAPAPKQVTVTGTTATINDPITGEEYVLVARGATPDWSKSQTDTTFAGLTPNTEYDLFVRKQATSGSFASEPVKTEIRTSVIIKEPETGGAGAGKEGNDVSEGKPSVDGDSVTYTGTCEEGSTPVIIVDGEEIIPEITWDEDGKKGTWSYTVPVEDGKSEVGIQVEFKDRTYTGLKIEPGSLHIYADDTANQSADKLLDYLKAHCTVKATYDNGTSDDATNGADYTTQTDFAPKSAVYEYTVEAAGNEGNPGKITLSVSSVNAAVETQVALTRTKQSGGYTKAEVDAWLPEKVTVTYTGDGGYAQRTESRSVIWDTDALGAGFGSVAGSKTISGTVDMPVWATGGNTASIGIEFVDRNILTDAQMNLSISGWAYGAQTAPAPKGSVTVTDTEQTYSYRYSADNGRSWVAADGLPKSGSGNIIPGDYQVEMTYSGRNYTGTKTAAFTVVQKPVTAEKGTLAVENRNYDGTTMATLKAGGKPALVGAVANDDVSLSGTLNAVFTNKGPKKNIPVTVTGFALTGGDAGYYKLVNTTLTLKATINNKDGSAPSSGSSSGNTSGEDSGIGENEGDSGDNGNSGNTGSDGSSGSSGNNGTGGNGTGTGSIGSGNTGDNGKGSTGSGGSGDTTGTGKGTSGTGKGGTGKDNAGGTGKGAGGDGSSTGKGTIGNGGTGNSGTGGTGKSVTSGTGNGTTGSGRDSTGSGTGNGDAGAQQTGNGQQTKSVTVQTVQAAADDGRIVISGETEAPVAIGTLTEDAPGATRLLVGEGTVTVTVVCEDDQYTVGMNDATAVANAVLTPEQIQRVDAGESLEIRVDIKNISQSIPPQDREIVEKGYEAYEKYLPDLTRGGYVDISVYIKTGDGGWNAVSETTEPLEVVIGIPEELRGDGREYYIIRAHEGRYTLLNDMDAVPETITIVTDLFSSYAIAYREAGGADTGNGETVYGLFQVSPKFLGIVSLIWLTVAVTGIIVVIIVLHRKKSSKKETVV